MNDFKESDYMVRFPPVLQQDESMLALGRLIAEELHITTQQTSKNIIYANIDNLPEYWLDILAYDMHVDWYDYDYPIETKRKVLKNSVRVHQKLGTKYAVETAIQSVYQSAKVEEWFEYDGEPYYFRLHIDIGNMGLSENETERTIKMMKYYKNLRSHCEKVCYSLSANRANTMVFANAKVGEIIKVNALLADNVKADTASTQLLSYIGTGNELRVEAKV